MSASGPSGPLVILVSNEMVNTGNHTVTMLIFSVFCFPMITDDKKPGYTVAFYTCKQILMFCHYIWNYQTSQPLIKAHLLSVNGNNF